LFQLSIVFGKSAQHFKRKQQQRYFFILFSAMALKTLVKAGQLSNLSDVRYCAGMGVDMLGFQVVKGPVHAVSFEHFKEMRGWFTGPQVVAEIYGAQTQNELEEIRQQFMPDFLEGSVAELILLSADYKNYILRVTREEWKTRKETILMYKQSIRYILLIDGDQDLLPEIVSDFQVLLLLNSTEHINRLLDQALINGVSVHGSTEEKPGLKNYDALADILEYLEQVD
jgi:phosphoribosylanthranilate isomerase